VTSCVSSFFEKYPKGSLVEDVYLGDQANATFLLEVAQSIIGSTGISGFDFIIDDGGHLTPQCNVTFLTLWPYVKEGGWYIVEDLQDHHSIWDFSRTVLGFTDQIMQNKARLTNPVKELAWTSFPTLLPPDMASMHCGRGICGFKKGDPKVLSKYDR
jgi:hypothetical protein